jgi:Co/Zn/Cd efflux system component
LNRAYFRVEFAIAHVNGLISLFADSMDFLEDASVKLLISLDSGWSAIAWTV